MNDVIYFNKYLDFELATTFDISRSSPVDPLPHQI